MNEDIILFLQKDLLPFVMSSFYCFPVASLISLPCMYAVKGYSE